MSMQNSLSFNSFYDLTPLSIVFLFILKKKKKFKISYVEILIVDKGLQKKIMVLKLRLVV
jgi:hypothetical protein